MSFKTLPLHKQVAAVSLLIVATPFYCTGRMLYCLGKVVKALGYLLLLMPQSAIGEFKNFFGVEGNIGDFL